MWLWQDRMGFLWGLMWFRDDPMRMLWGLGEPYGVWGEPRGSNAALGGFYGDAMGSGGTLWGLGGPLGGL